MKVRTFLDPYLIPLLAALIGIAVGFWMIWPEPERPDNFEELIRVPLAEEVVGQ